MNNKFYLIIIPLFLIMSGCGNKQPEYSPLEPPTENVEEVTNFSSFEMPVTPTPVPTATPTPIPTATPTPEPTPVQTEEPEPSPTPVPDPEVAFSKDYDFSEYTVLQAVFYQYGGLGSVPYTCTIRQDPETKIRTEDIVTEDGKIKVSLYGDPVSGSTYKKVIIEASGEDPEGTIRSALLSFDNGINNDNIDLFLEGEYDGQSDAPYLGLYDASCEIENGKITVTLVKNDTDEGETPYWDPEVGSTDISIPEGSFRNGTIEDAEIIKLLNSVDMNVVTLQETKNASYEKVVNEKMEIISETAGYSAKYNSGTGEYTLESAETGFMISIKRDDLKESYSAMNIADRIYKYFYHGDIDTEYDLENGSYKADHIEVLKSDDIVKIHLF